MQEAEPVGISGTSGLNKSPATIRLCFMQDTKGFTSLHQHLAGADSVCVMSIYFTDQDQKERYKFCLVEANTCCGEEYSCLLSLVTLNLITKGITDNVVEFTRELFLFELVINSHEYAFLFPQPVLVGQNLLTLLAFMEKKKFAHCFKHILCSNM